MKLSYTQISPENSKNLFSSTNEWKYSKTFLPANLSYLQINNILELFKDFPAAISNQQPAISNQQSATSNQQPAINNGNQQQQSAAATSSNQQQQPAFILPAAPTRSTPAPVKYHYGS